MRNVKFPVNWVGALFLTGSTLATLILVPVFFYFESFRWSLLVLCLVGYYLTAISITGGYHRLIAHKAYAVPNWVKTIYLLIGAAAFQNSAYVWGVDHRFHHRYVDTDKDPYNINKGFWWAHMGWMFVKTEDRDDTVFSRDLRADKLIMWQHKHYVAIAIFMCFVVPTIIGAFLGSWFGGFVFGGLLRLVITHHATFFINSFAHMFGRQPFSKKHSARDNFVLAIVTCGEGYHNFHHEFAYDYRNGIRWFDFDPTKWLINLLKWCGLATQLKTVSPVSILKVKVAQELQTTQPGVETSFPQMKEAFEKLNVQIHKALDRWEHHRTEYLRFKNEKTKLARERMKQIRVDVQAAKREFRLAHQALRSFRASMSNA